MKITFVAIFSLIFMSCSQRDKDNSTPTNDASMTATAVDTTSISGITIQINNTDYGFTRINQWSFGGFSSSYKGLGPAIDTYNNDKWPSTFVHFGMQAFFRNTNYNFPPDSFQYIDLANRSSIDTVVIEVTLSPSNSMNTPWAIYSNVFSEDNRQIVWVPQTTGKVGFNKYVPCPYTNPGHTYDMNVTFGSVLLSLVDSSGPLSGYGFPQTVTVKNAFFKTIKY